MFGRRSDSSPGKAATAATTENVGVKEGASVSAREADLNSSPESANGADGANSVNAAAGVNAANTVNTIGQLMAVDKSSAVAAAPTAAMSPLLNELRLLLLERLDASVVLRLNRAALRARIIRESGELASQRKLPLTAQDQQQLADALLDDMLGLGPIQALLDDPTVADVLVNGPFQVYVERRGKLQPAGVQFHDEAHVKHVARRIAAAIGRRIDESNPMVDARLEDGSRVNIIIPPLALDGTSISIRKFNRDGFDLEHLVRLGSMTAEMAQLLKIATASRANILISGGTGAGKTSLLNALSRHIGGGERIVTIEDAAELALQQPHVVRLETRPPSLEGGGGINQQQLLVNALRMRPDRIVLGEVRSNEAFDMMQAMNTGHDGSMSTLHANSPGDALIRLENLLLMQQANVPLVAIRRQMVSALDMIVQVNRDRDGIRRVTAIVEVIGIEGDTVTLQTLWQYKSNDNNPQEAPSYQHQNLRPALMERARTMGLGDELQALVNRLSSNSGGFNTQQSGENFG